MGNKLLVDGVTTTDHDTILQCWVDHFKKIMESKARSNPDIQKAADEMENLLIQSFLWMVFWTNRFPLMNLKLLLVD